MSVLKSNKQIAEDIYDVKNELMYVGRKIEAEEISLVTAREWLTVSRDKLTVLRKLLK